MWTSSPRSLRWRCLAAHQVGFDQGPIGILGTLEVARRVSLARARQLRHGPYIHQPFQRLEDPWAIRSAFETDHYMGGSHHLRGPHEDPSRHGEDVLMAVEAPRQ